MSRLWRLQKSHHKVDAELHDTDGGVELFFRYDGALAYRRRCETRVLAVAAASEKRLELERSGWTSHW